eukprot:2504889-Alexandrium_andersonii.AAC.1
MVADAGAVRVRRQALGNRLALERLELTGARTRWCQERFEKADTGDWRVGVHLDAEEMLAAVESRLQVQHQRVPQGTLDVMEVE